MLIAGKGGIEMVKLITLFCLVFHLFFITNASAQSGLHKTVDGINYEYPFNDDKSIFNGQVGNFIVVYDGPAKGTSDTEQKITVNPTIAAYVVKLKNKVNKNDLVFEASLNSRIENAQVIFKKINPTGKEFPEGSIVYVEIKTQADRLAFVRSQSLNPAAGLPGVKTYLEIDSTADKPLWLGPNLAVWKGSIYYEGKGKIFISKEAGFSLK
jgi:hypothetical protein